jgi:hypothetical protein|tara:strand:- start:52 stop:807 length:756 start_codon:yes stop_codon:yes gene_type:complete
MWKKYPLKYKEETIVSFNEDEHRYFVNGKEVKSATTIIDRGLIKPRLLNWMITTPMYKFKDLINSKLDNNEPIDRATLERIFKEARSKTQNMKEDGALIGSVVHGLIEDFIHKKKIPTQSDPKVVNCWNMFLDWWNEQGYEVVEIEKKLYSKKYNFVGTLDLIVKDKSGKLVLIDIKTSNFISFGYVLQANAYKFAYEEETGNKISSAFCLRLGKTDKKPEIAPMPINKKMFNAFLGAKYITEQMEESEYK